MAVRFPGTAGNFYSRASAIPTLGNVTITWWMKYAASVTNRNNPIAIYLDGSSYIYYQTDGVSGTRVNFHLSGNGSNVLTLVDIGLDTWYFFALVINGTSIRNYYLPWGGGSLSLNQSFAGSAVWFTPSNLRLSQRPDTFGRINGTIANVKIWQASLSLTELELERSYYPPLRTQDLHTWTPLFVGADRNLDESGNGHDWTINGAGMTDEADLDLPLVLPLEVPGLIRLLPYADHTVALRKYSEPSVREITYPDPIITEL